MLGVDIGAGVPFALSLLPSEEPPVSVVCCFHDLGVLETRVRDGAGSLLGRILRGCKLSASRDTIFESLG